MQLRITQTDEYVMSWFLPPDGSNPTTINTMLLAFLHPAGMHSVL